ncbi:MAG: alpha-L-glutamate ligase-like protein [Gammaproteobacteria bacterium]|nr:alpha-L-glutamate ligase-like protein [Gammaproteobacteria bacterium]
MSTWIDPRQLSRRGVLGMNRRNVAYIGRYNERERYPLVDDKLKTKLIAHNAGVHVPKLLHVVSAQHEIEDIEAKLEPLSEFVIKPAQGSGGKGILVIESKDDEGFIKSSGERITLNTVKRHLSNIISGLHSLGGRYDVAIIESLVKVSALFKNVSYEGVPDIRLIVFQGYPVMGMLRLATTASDGKANLHQGAVGVGLDIGTGMSVAAVQSNRVVKTHPDTGEDLTRLAVPNWRQLLILAAQCFEVTQLGYLGCDIVIDENRGPLLLELNARPGLSIQIANDAGLLPRLRHIEELESFAPTVEDRVDYAMQTFSRMRRAEQTNLWEDQ